MGYINQVLQLWAWYKTAGLERELNKTNSGEPLKQLIKNQTVVSNIKLAVCWKLYFSKRLRRIAASLFVDSLEFSQDGNLYLMKNCHASVYACVWQRSRRCWQMWWFVMWSATESALQACTDISGQLRCFENAQSHDSLNPHYIQSGHICDLSLSALLWSSWENEIKLCTFSYLISIFNQRNYCMNYALCK